MQSLYETFLSLFDLYQMIKSTFCTERLRVPCLAPLPTPTTRYICAFHQLYAAFHIYSGAGFPVQHRHVETASRLVHLYTQNTISQCPLPAVCGVSQSVTKSTTLCSISSTVVDFPFRTVMLCVRPALSVGSPPENITRLSLEFTKTLV